mmetsp:Transcript_2900/g.6145  ORF Transcript_2900/g.6145 Transcript_2900/m.6145 type:complete len:208 (+) Transcript_2900:94-717(+)
MRSSRSEDSSSKRDPEKMGPVEMGRRQQKQRQWRRQRKLARLTSRRKWKRATTKEKKKQQRRRLWRRRWRSWAPLLLGPPSPHAAAAAAPAEPDGADAAELSVGVDVCGVCGEPRGRRRREAVGVRGHRRAGARSFWVAPDEPLASSRVLQQRTKPAPALDQPAAPRRWRGGRRRWQEEAQPVTVPCGALRKATVKYIVVEESKGRS